MARSGTSSRLVSEGAPRSAGTRKLLVDAAIETLRAQGFAGASARAIAARAGCNQALVFYHFGTVASLLLAALDAVSAARLERYGAAVERAASPPGLGAEVAARLAPWRDFAQQAIDSVVGGSPLGSLVPSGELAHGVVALYLGLELLSHLDAERDAALSLFERAKQFAALVELLGLAPTAPAAPPEADK